MPFSLLSGLPDAQQQILQQGFLQGLQQAAENQRQQAQIQAEQQQQKQKEDFAQQQQQAEWQHQWNALLEQRKYDADQLAKQNGVQYYTNKLKTYGDELDATYSQASQYVNDADYSDAFRKQAQDVMNQTQKQKLGLANVYPTEYDPNVGIPQLSEPLPQLGTPEFTPEYLKSVQEKYQLPEIQAQHLAETIRHNRAMEGLSARRLSDSEQRNNGANGKAVNGFISALGAYNDWSNTSQQAHNAGVYSYDYSNDEQKPDSIKQWESLVAKKRATAQAMWEKNGIPFLFRVGAGNDDLGIATRGLAQKYNNFSTPEDVTNALQESHQNYWNPDGSMSPFGKFFEFLRHPISAVNTPTEQAQTEDRR